MNYPIYTSRGAHLYINEVLRSLSPDRVFTVSDSNVYPLYGHLFERDGHFVFPAGESSKTLDTVTRIYNAFHAASLTRSSVVLALGGGVTGDMAGFAAATYMRGIRVVQIPTSIIAQNDSSMGGKTGVDMPFGKNAVGAFHNPSAVICDLDFLSTLPPYFVRDGLGEVIKHGIIANPDLFDILCSGSYTFDEIIPMSQAVKIAIVDSDERETGTRALLNLGHTIGHAIEKCENYSGLSHGMAVSVGIVWATRISESLGIAERGLLDRILFALTSLGLPTQTDIPPKKLFDAALADKKRNGDKISLVLPRRIGLCEIVPTEIAKIAEVMGA